MDTHSCSVTDDTIDGDVLAVTVAEQGNPVGIRNTADQIRGAVCTKLLPFLRKQVIGAT